MPTGTALVVDDNEASALLARTLLEIAGFEVVVATSAENALTGIRKLRPDVVVIDLFLPGLDGLGFARIVRGDPAIARTPLVGVTSADPDHYRAHGLESVCDGFLRKPLSVHDFARDVSRIARRVARAGARTGEARCAL